MAWCLRLRWGWERRIVCNCTVFFKKKSYHCIFLIVNLNEVHIYQYEYVYHGFLEPAPLFHRLSCGPFEFKGLLCCIYYVFAMWCWCHMIISHCFNSFIVTVILIDRMESHQCSLARNTPCLYSLVNAVKVDSELSCSIWKLFQKCPTLSSITWKYHEIFKHVSHIPDPLRFFIIQ